jgi:hypothetical protein
MLLDKLPFCYNIRAVRSNLPLIGESSCVTGEITKVGGWTLSLKGEELPLQKFTVPVAHASVTRPIVVKVGIHFHHNLKWCSFE